MSKDQQLIVGYEISAFPEKTSKLSAEIASLMREGGEECRKKARRLLQTAMDERTTKKPAAHGDI